MRSFMVRFSFWSGSAEVATHGRLRALERLRDRARGGVELAPHAGELLALGIDLVREARLALAVARDGRLDLADALLGVLAQLRDLLRGGVDAAGQRLQFLRAGADL